MSDHINGVLERIDDRYIQEAACCHPGSAGRRRALRLALIAACIALLMTVGVAGWKLVVRLAMGSDGVRRYTYYLLDDIPKNAPAQVETVWLPDVSVLGKDYQLAFCSEKETPAGAYIVTVYCGDPGGQLSVSQFPLAVFENYTKKLASANYMPDEVRSARLGDKEVLCEILDGVIYSVIWSDGSYCYRVHSSRYLADGHWSLLLRSFRPEPDYTKMAEAHPYYHPDSGTLETVLIPGFLPDEMGDFSYSITPYCAEWSIYNQEGYGLLFEQTPLDVRNYYTEDGSAGPYYGGEIMDWFLVGGTVIYEGYSSAFRDYFWYEGGDRCQLRFDKETGLDFRPLAIQIIENMSRTAPADAEAFYAGME